MAPSATGIAKTAARRRTSKLFLLTLLLLTLVMAASAGAAASRAAGLGRPFVVAAARSPGLGTIVVDSQPTSADVRLDGIDAGRSTPTTFAGLAPGTHQVSVTIPGFQPWQQTVTVAAGVTTTLHAALLVALPAAASTEVTVTTASDALDGDASSIAALQASPGPDSAISLREAITAANATAGVKVIRFAPALKGAVITPGLVTGQSLPVLTGGDIWIIGDIDGDGSPDVTIDGRLSGSISIWSSSNVVSGLQFVNCSGFNTVALCPPPGWTGPAKTLADDRVLGNSVTGSAGFGVGPFGLISAADPVPISNLTWSGLIFAGNQIDNDTGGILAYAGGGCAHDNLITDLTIACNTMTGSAGIGVIASDTNSQWQGVPGPIQYGDHNSVQGVTIAHNRWQGEGGGAIGVLVADMGNSDCAISDVAILDNDISFSASSGPLGAIGLSAGGGSFAAGERPTAGDSLTHVEVRGNRIQGASNGIDVNASDNYSSPLTGRATDNVASDIVVTGNEIRDSSACGILAAASQGWGPGSCSNATLSGLSIRGNLITNATTAEAGIRLAGGYGGGDAQLTGNELTGASVTGNTVRGFDKGIWVSAGEGAGAVGNTLTGSSSGNSVSATEPWLLVANDAGASGNTLTFAAAELTPKISKLSPASGKRRALVTITGRGFGAHRGTNTVKFGAKACTKYISWSATRIKCKVPTKAKLGRLRVTVRTKGGTSNAKTFKVRRS